MASFAEESHTSAMMMKLATGTLLMVSMRGARKISTVCTRPARKASTVPSRKASRKPEAMCRKLVPRDAAKPSSFQMVKSLRTTSMGEAKRILFPRSIAAACQRASSVSAARSFF